MRDPFIDTSAGGATPEGFRETASGLVVPAEALRRARHTVTEEQGKVLDQATKIANAYGWFLNFGCPHEQCREQPLVQGIQIPGGQRLRCQHQEVTVMRPLPGKPNAAIQRRRQAAQARLEERAIGSIAKRIVAEEDAKPAAAAQTGRVDGETA